MVMPLWMVCHAIGAQQGQVDLDALVGSASSLDDVRAGRRAVEGAQLQPPARSRPTVVIHAIAHRPLAR
jgi:hypothetical protein